MDGVLHQFGEQVGDVRHRVPADPGPGHGPQPHPLVVLDLGGRRTHHVHQGHRILPPAGRVGSGEDEQVVGIAAALGDQVVQAQQPTQGDGVVLGRLDLVEQAQLALDEGLVAVGDPQEDPVGPLADLRLPDGRGHRGALGGVERVGDPADLVLSVAQRGQLGGDVHPGAGAGPGDDLGQAGVGDLQRLGVQPVQSPGEPPGQTQRVDDGDGPRHEDDQAARDVQDDDPHRGARGRVERRRGLGGDQVLEHRFGVLHDVLPLRGVHGDLRVEPGLAGGVDYRRAGQHLQAEFLQPDPRGGLVQRLVSGARPLAQLRFGPVERVPVGGGEEGEVRGLGVPHRARGQRPGQQGVGLGVAVLRPHQLQRGGAVGARAVPVQPGHDGVVDQQDRREQRGVVLERRLPVGLPVVDLLPQRGQALPGVEEVADPVREFGVVGVEQECGLSALSGEGRVGVLPGLRQSVAGRRGTVAQEHLRRLPFGAQFRGDQGERRHRGLAPLDRGGQAERPGGARGGQQRPQQQEADAGDEHHPGELAADGASADWVVLTRGHGLPPQGTTVPKSIALGGHFVTTGYCFAGKPASDAVSCPCGAAIPPVRAGPPGWAAAPLPGC